MIWQETKVGTQWVLVSKCPSLGLEKNLKSIFLVIHINVIIDLLYSFKKFFFDFVFKYIWILGLSASLHVGGTLFQILGPKQEIPLCPILVCLKGSANFKTDLRVFCRFSIREKMSYMTYMLVPILYKIYKFSQQSIVHIICSALVTSL